MQTEDESVADTDTEIDNSPQESIKAPSSKPASKKKSTICMSWPITLQACLICHRGHGRKAVDLDEPEEARDTF